MGVLDCLHGNPCGQHGYCILDVSAKLWKCQCNFWWTGTVCDDLTDTAKQVIELSCILAFLLLIRYGLVFYQYLKTKKNSKEQTNKITIVPRFKNWFYLLKKSIRLSSTIVCLFTLLVTCLTLLLKQLLMNSVVDNQLIANETNVTINSTLCSIINYKQRINLILLPIAVLYILIYSFNQINSKCNRLFSLPVPLNYLSIKNRLFYASISIILTQYLFSFIQRNYNEASVITTFLLQLFDVLLLSLRYYPILICFYKQSIYTLVFGSIYVWLDYAMMILEQNLCQLNIPPIIIDIPNYLSFSYIIILFIQILIQKFIFRRKTNSPIQENILRNFTPEERFLCENLSNASTVQYSIRIISTYAAIIYLLYYIIIQVSLELPSKIVEIEDEIQNYFSFIPFKIPIPNLIRASIISLSLTSCLLMIQLILLLRTIRSDLEKAFQGKFKKPDPSQHVVYSRGNISFAGFFVGNFIWNFIILMICFLIILIPLELLIAYGNSQLLEKLINIILPSFLFYFIKDCASELLCQYIFLNKHANDFRINNFRFLMIFMYLNYLFDNLITFVFAFIHLLKIWLISIISMMRFDDSLFGEKFEEYDAVHSSYQAFIYFESIYRNPIMRLFLANIYLQMKIRQHCNITQKKYVNRWKLAYFLIRNPSMRQFRRQMNMHTLLIVD